MGLCWDWEHPVGRQRGSVFTAEIKSAHALVLRGVLCFCCSTKHSRQKLPHPLPPAGVPALPHPRDVSLALDTHRLS